MRTLLILRHAKAKPEDAATTDHERPLAERGLRDARRVGEWLASEALVPDAILTSTAVRAKTTAEIVRSALGADLPLKLESSLYLASPDRYLAALRGWPDDEACVLVVGHNPGLEELVTRVSGVREALATASLAHVRFPVRSWSELPQSPGGVLVSLRDPEA